MEQLSGGDMIVRALEDEGVEYLGYLGGAALHIYTPFSRRIQCPIFWYGTSRRQLTQPMAMRALRESRAWCW